MSIFKKKSSPLVHINDLNTSSDYFKIKVHILKVWDGYKSKKGSPLEMVLVDEKGDRIQATVDTDCVSILRNKLIEGRSVLLDTFKVVPYQSTLRTSRSSFKILFYATTGISPCDDFPSHVPENYMVTFDEISSEDLDRSYMIDVMGQIVRLGNIEDVTAQGKISRRLRLDLRDTSDSRLSCTLWGEYAGQVSEYVKDNVESVIVCVIRLACVREYQSVNSVSNAFSTTKIFLDPVNPRVEEFRKNLPADKCDLTPTGDISSTADNNVTLYDEFFVVNPRKNLSEIHDAEKTGKCVTIATVASLGNNNNWYYIGCAVCNKKVHPYPENTAQSAAGLWKCIVCKKDVSKVVACYFIVLNVSDASGYMASFLIFDPLANVLFKKSAEELYEEAGMDAADGLPPAIESLMGREMLFKLNISDDNIKRIKTSYVLEKYSDEAEMVYEFKNGVSSRPSATTPAIVDGLESSDTPSITPAPATNLDLSSSLAPSTTPITSSTPTSKMSSTSKSPPASKATPPSNSSTSSKRVRGGSIKTPDKAEGPLTRQKI